MNSMLDKIKHLESLPGILLIFAGGLALILSNSFLAPYYEFIFHSYLTIHLAGLWISKPLLIWINDGLMAIFFLLVGLEVKREFYEGYLSSFPRVILPAIGALGGIIVPASIFIALNHDNPKSIHGWAIPTATDIAFAIGILILLGSRVPRSLKVLLTTIAIFDDLVAIAIIAIFYSGALSYLSLMFAGLCILILFGMNLIKVRALGPYCFVGFILWICVLKSGVHATLSGVVLAFAIPLRVEEQHSSSPLHRMEIALYPWVTFVILPLFALANAGIQLSKLKLTEVFDPVPLGIAMGLFLGKQIGVFSFSWLSVHFKLAEKPFDLNWKHIYGMSLLCGIGFTMSLFIGGLAYPPSMSIYSIVHRLGILVGSLLSAIVGYCYLRHMLKPFQPKAQRRRARKKSSEHA